MMADAAALFVKTTRFVESMPADIIELADKRKFPIVEVPQGLRWTRLMQDATEVIINRQASQLEQSQAIHRSLLGVVIRGGGLAGPGRRGLPPAGDAPWSSSTPRWRCWRLRRACP